MRLGMGRKKIRIGDILVAAGAITEEQLQEALAYQKERREARKCSRRSGNDQ